MAENDRDENGRSALVLTSIPMEVPLENHRKARDSFEWRKYLTLTPGIRFEPTDQELIFEYLSQKVLGFQTWKGIIKEIDLYKYEPEALKELYDDIEKMYNDGKMYLYTKLHKKHENGERISRETEKGFWRSTQGPVPIKGEDQNPIGHKISLAYYSRKNKTEVKKTQWLMQEFRLNPSNQNQIQASHKLENWVLCKVYFKGKKGGENNKGCYDGPQIGSSMNNDIDDQNGDPLGASNFNSGSSVSLHPPQDIDVTNQRETNAIPKLYANSFNNNFWETTNSASIHMPTIETSFDDQGLGAIVAESRALRRRRF